MKYFAYGSNMHVSQMQQRCPSIKRIGKCRLAGFRLVFNYHADIIPAEGCSVHGALWQITEDDEKALDGYEGYPSYYGKYYEGDLMFYRMKEAYANPEPPAKWYLQTVVQGYCDFGLTREDFKKSLGVKQLGLTQTALEQILGVSMDELEHLFSRAATTCDD